MSFSGLTPESLIERSDSKNPATTCKGITTTGRPCRRGLAFSPNQSPAPSPTRNSTGVVAVLDEGSAAAYFCWQHKDQAEQLVARLEQQQRTRILPLTKKSSIETLVEKLGVVDLDADADNVKQRTSQTSGGYSYARRVKKRDTLPREWQAMHGPLMSVPEEVVTAEVAGQRPLKPSTRPSTQSEKKFAPSSVRPPAQSENKLGRSNVKASWSCCIRADNDDIYNDDGPPARKRQNRRISIVDSSATYSGTAQGSSVASTKIGRSQPEIQNRQNRYSYDASKRTSIEAQQRIISTRPPPQPLLSSSSPPHSQTSNFLSLIPAHLSPTTTSALLAELSKPISETDEPGYIYIFWLTPESEMSKPDDETASSLLDDDYADLGEFSSSPSPSPRKNISNNTQRHGHRLSWSSQNQTTSPKSIDRQSAALKRYASVSSRPDVRSKQTVLLKIGRASNVHRRLSQWTKQCGQNITLIRYYPYPNHNQHSIRNMSGSGKTVPNVNKVERLIHLELAESRVSGKGACVNCGREHREWFEVEATRQGIKAVDEVVRRWVGWTQAASST